MKNFPKKKIKAFIYIGGSYPQIQGVKAIKKSGLFVILIDRNSNSPCSKYVDLHLRVDALEIEKIKKKLMQYILNYEFLGIYGIGDFANDTISKLNVFLKINNNNNNDILTSFTNKINTHKIWSKLNLPKTKLLWSGKKVPTDKNLTYILKESNKIVIKPSSSHGSNGITICSSENFTSAKNGIVKALNISKQALIEEFKEGEIVNIDGLMIDNSLRCVSLIKRGEKTLNENLKYIFGIGFFNLSKRRKKLLAVLVKKLVLSLGYINGPFTIDTIYKNKCFYPIEISPHLHAVRFYNNDCLHPLTLWGNYLKSNKQINFKFYNKKIGYCAIISKKKEKFKFEGLSKFLNARYIVDFYSDENSGKGIKESNSLNIPLIFWYKFISKKDLLEKLNKIKELD